MLSFVDYDKFGLYFVWGKIVGGFWVGEYVMICILKELVM